MGERFSRPLTISERHGRKGAIFLRGLFQHGRLSEKFRMNAILKKSGRHVLAFFAPSPQKYNRKLL
jgi:hypothetical protein